MIYKIFRHDKESDDITQQSFNDSDEAYDLLEEMLVVLMLIMGTVPIMKLLR